MSTRALLSVTHTNGKSSNSMMLDTSSTLLDIRNILIERGIMERTDMFLRGNSEIYSADEAEITLSVIIENNALCIGHTEPQGISDDPDDEVDWRFINDSKKLDLLYKCELNRGFTLSASGLGKTHESLFSFKLLPKELTPRVNTEEISAYSFSKVTRDLNLISSNRSSLSLNAPFASAEVEFKHAKEKTTSSSVIVEYMVQKYVVSKASFKFDPNSFTVNDGFEVAVDAALKRGDSEKDKLCYLLHVLNEWGMYIPLRFTLGGMLYSFEETQISDYTQAQKEYREFSASAKASYASFSSGGSYGSSSSSSSSEATSTKYTNLVVNQIGGKPGKTQDKVFLANSLDNAKYWQIVDVEEYYPSLMLLNKSRNPNVAPNLFTKCIALLNKSDFYKAVTSEIQPVIDPKKYATSIEALLLAW